MIFQRQYSSFQLTPSRMKQAIFISMTLLMISSCSEKVSPQADNQGYYQSAALVTIAPEQNYTIAREYLGQVTAKQHTSLSFEYSGKVREIFVDNGDIVSKGELLAQQDTELLNYKTAELQAKIAQSQAQIALNIANLKRINTLISDGYSSKQRLDELTAENQILNAQIKGLNAQIQTIEYQQEKSSLVAPFDGVITQRLISNGEVVRTNYPSFRIMESANNEINVGIPSKIASILTLGQVLQIKINDQHNQAELIAIGQQIDAINRTVQLRLKMLENKENTKNFNGQLVRITIQETIEKPGFWLPINAITDGVRGQWQIFIASTSTELNNNYQLQAATVNILHANELSVYVTGLAMKEHKIISQGVHRYVGGQIISATAPVLANSVGNH